MSNYYRRHGLVGPAVLITIGAIFMADRWLPGLTVGRLWPVILIVIGIVRLLEMSMSREETVYPAPPQPPPPGTPPPPPPAGSGQ
jgi:hypothetical protein